MQRTAQAALLAFVFVLAGCGGSNDTSAGGEETTSAPPPQQPNKRLSQQGWNEFLDVQSKARTTNNKAIVTFQTCRQLIFSTAPADKVDQCLGDTTDSVVTVGKQTMASLQDLKPGTAGACAQANDALTGNVKLYVASVQAVGSSVQSGNVAAAQPHIDNALEALKHTRPANDEFERQCKPVA